MDPRPLKILAIDDVPANLYLLELALQQEYQFRIASSGAEGLRLAHDDPPDLILLDVMMPDMDGYEVCRLLKQDPRLQDIPVMFVTAQTGADAEAKGLALGAADYLCKPVNLDIARMRIRNVLEREMLRRELRQQARQQGLIASVFDHIQDGILICDASNNIIDVNQAFTRITGYEREDVLGHNPRILKSGRQSPEFYQAMWHALLTKNHWSGQLWNRHKNGDIFAALTSISAVRGADQNIQHFIGLFTDITQLKNYESTLERIAHFDPLTGVPNRLLLADRLKQAIAQTLRTGTQMAICYMDLDCFKPVNDCYGHIVGDQLLVTIAQRIKDCLRAGDTVARMGGDEFVLLLLGFNDARECEAVLARMLTKVAECALVQGHRLMVSASLGYTLFPADPAEAEELLHHADQAMYVAKEQGKNGYHRYQPPVCL